MFNLTQKQKEAHDKILAISKKRFSRPYVFRVRGYAGTGKTTLLKVVHERIGRFVSVAPTGKAALRISEAAGLDASTVHRWLYNAQPDPTTGEIRLVRKRPEEVDVPESGLLVVDESSMLDEQLWEDIYDMCSLVGMNIVLVGDGFQLPPVAMKEGRLFSVMDDAFMCDDGVDLTEVMRQALESPIIRASMLLRGNDAPEALTLLPHVKKASLLDEAQGLLGGGGALICHANKTRHTLNNAIRKRLFADKTHIIHVDEPLLVLKNNYSTVPNMYNGEVVPFMGWDHEPKDKVKVSNMFKQLSGEMSIGVAEIGSYGATAALALEMVKGSAEAEVLGEEAFAPAVKRLYGKGMPFLSANFGYTLTAHKAQGSEWGEVIVVVEPTVRPNDYFGRRWLYTAVTRAKNSCKLAIANREEVEAMI